MNDKFSILPLFFMSLILDIATNKNNHRLVAGEGQWFYISY